MSADPIVAKRPIPVEEWGPDHNSTLSYAETVCVDRHGIPEKQRMRCDRMRHPGHAHLPPGVDGRCPTRLAGDLELPEHDDWDCIDDAEDAGFIEIHGTGLHPVWRMTDAGFAYVHALRRKRQAISGDAA